MRSKSSIVLAVVATLAAGAPAAAARDPTPIAAALARYRALAADSGWQVPGSGPVLRRGDRHGDVAPIRIRLVRTGDLPGAPADQAPASRFDADLERAVRRFQTRHGLIADGVIGPATRAALAVPVTERVRQLEEAAATVARPAPATRWIRINVPRFWLELIDGESVVLEMPVVVGRPSRPTPTFESTISWIQLNPPWTVPPALAHEDLLPRIRRDPRYLASRRIDVLDGWARDARRIDPASIDWSTIGADIRKLTLRQRPGPGNAMGRVLFYMDNAHDVYLHDTPRRELFRARRRDFSSGCIRVANARGLVGEILRGDTSWPARRIDTALATGDTTDVRVPHPMPVRVVYQTAWVDGDGVVQFRDDIYAGARRAEPDVRLGRVGQPTSQSRTTASAF